MTVVYRSEQKSMQMGDDVTAYLATHKSNGATMLAVYDLLVKAGGVMPYRRLDVECTWFFVKGEYEVVRGTEMIRVNAGDSVYLAPNVAASFKNLSDSEGQVVSFCLSPYPRIETLEPPTDVTASTDDKGVYRRQPSYEFFPGVDRWDVTGDHIGASCYMADVIFNVGSKGIPRHYHPAHEEAMLVLEGELNFFYGDKEGIVCKAGDAFLAETKIIHGSINKSDQPTRMLAIHPLLNPPRIFIDEE